MGKKVIKKFNKPIRYDSLIRILDACEGGQGLPDDTFKTSIEIKDKFFELTTLDTLCPSQELDGEEVKILIKQIHKFNIDTRCYSSAKWKKNNPPGNYAKASEVGSSDCDHGSPNPRESCLSPLDNLNPQVLLL